MMPATRRDRDSGGTKTPSEPAHFHDYEHPSTPSSTSGTGASRTLYAGSTASSSAAGAVTHRTGGSSPIDAESAIVAALKERHELEKDALLSALGESKRANKQLTQEKAELQNYAADLEARLEAALELNRKMDGVRAAVMALTGGGISPGPASADESVPKASKAKRRGADAMELLAARRRGAFDESGARSKSSLATSTKRPRTVDSFDEHEAPSDRHGHTPYSARLLSGRTADYLTINGGPIPRQKKLITRRSADEGSVILPAMKASRETSMLLNELPPQPEDEYATSDAADDDGETNHPDEGDRTASRHNRYASSPKAAPSFSFMDADEHSLASSGGSLRLRLSDELHLAELVSLGPCSADERTGPTYDAGYDSNECF